MTENKRFALAYEKGNWWAVRDGDITLWKEEVVALLNSLNEENEQLKQEIFEISKELLWAASDEVDRVLYYEDEVEELRKEIFND